MAAGYNSNLSHPLGKLPHDLVTVLYGYCEELSSWATAVLGRYNWAGENELSFPPVANLPMEDCSIKSADNLIEDGDRRLSSDINAVIGKTLPEIKQTSGWENANLGNGEPWCALFVKECLSRSSLSSYAQYISSSTSDSIAALAAASCSYYTTATVYAPNTTFNKSNSIAFSDVQEGDIIAFDWTMTDDDVGSGAARNGRYWDHIGLIKSTATNSLTTIEGNAQNKVMERTFTLSSGKLSSSQASEVRHFVIIHLQ